ncbi:MAG: hypothetical protein HBSAPP02_27660 [Phycisphaerae bacterium]|nr:MAG: hypothetical protein HBSAPP02_27660 [Phycisphaerae bacterium]
MRRGRLLKTMRESPQDDKRLPLVRLGQGDYVKDIYPEDLNHETRGEDRMAGLLKQVQRGV